MRLKSFTANSMKEAMQMVRDTLGEDAIIIATREENGGKSVRVTAAIEKDRPPISDIDLPLEPEDWVFDDDDDEATVIEELTEIMLRHSVPEDVLDQVISAASVMGLEDTKMALFSALDSLFDFRPLPTKAINKPLIIIGPPGAGKTLATAKLAARGAMNNLTMQVITTDTIRAGGIEQLEAFTRLMDIDLQKAEDADQLKQQIAHNDNADQILIDTAGVNPFDKDAMKELAKLIGSLDVYPVLALPAGSDSDEMGEIARIFATLGARALLPTRVDVARRLGGLLSAAHQGGLHFTDTSNTPKVADGLIPMNAKRLTQLLMPSTQNIAIDKKVRKTG